LIDRITLTIIVIIPFITGSIEAIRLNKSVVVVVVVVVQLIRTTQETNKQATKLVITVSIPSVIGELPLYPSTWLYRWSETKYPSICIITVN
jgi:hypothetical protein